MTISKKDLKTNRDIYQAEIATTGEKINPLGGFNQTISWPREQGETDTSETG